MSSAGRSVKSDGYNQHTTIHPGRVRRSFRFLTRHEMRQPDINRVKRAKEHLKAATTILCNINWLNTSMIESNFITLAKEDIEEADAHLTDIINIQADR